MCTVSFIGEHYSEKWKPYVQPFDGTSYPPTNIQWVPTITRKEFDQLKADVQEMKALLIKAKKYDEDHGEPDCEMEDKVQMLKLMAEFFGVSLEDIF